MFNPKRAWLEYCWQRKLLLDKWVDTKYIDILPPSFGFYDFKPKHRKRLRKAFYTAIKKEWKGELRDKYNELLEFFDYI